MDKFNALKIFILVAHNNSFAEAAKQLGANPSTISKAIERLEKSLNARLFQRTTRSLSLTQTGERYLLTVERLFNELQLCEWEMLKEENHPSGVLKLNVPEAYGRLYIRPLLTGFCQEYPNVCVEMSSCDTYVDSVSEGVDISIRTGPITVNGFIVQTLSSMDMLTCAAPQLAQKLRLPLTPNRFHEVPWLRYRFKQTGKLLSVQTWENNKITHHDPGRTIITDDGEMIAELCADGLGVAQMPHFIFRQKIRNEKVIPIMPMFRLPNASVYIFYPKRKYKPARVRAFVDYLKQFLTSIDEFPERTWADTLEKRNNCSPQT